MRLDLGSKIEGPGTSVPHAGNWDRGADDLLEQDQRLELLRQEVRSAAKMAKKNHWPVGREEINASMEKAEKAYKEYIHERRGWGLSPRIVDDELQLRETEKAFQDLAELILEKPEENRACWLDRKTIVSPGPGDLRKEIERLKDAGIKTIYFECDNGGYSHYDSKLLQKNPDLTKWTNWDPLREAIDAAHSNGMKVDAWTKTLSFCNRALDDLLRQSHPDQVFPPAGPVFSQHDSNSKEPFGDWALRMPDGKYPERTMDLFIDPANPRAREFAQNMMLEIASQYPDLDGIQYDYIRYPFQNEAMGLNDNSWTLFQSQFPQYKDVQKPADPRQMNAQMIKDWNEMKVSLIDSFVEDTSAKLKQANPNLDISAAVYPLDLNFQVRQNWAKWIKNGWVNTLNPMTYVPHDTKSKDAEFSPEFEKKFRGDISEILEATEGKGKVLPGIAVSRVNPSGILKETELVKQMGLEGETLFASSVLDSRRIKEFEVSDGKRDFNEFNQLLKSVWSLKDDDGDIRRVHKEFIHDAEIAAKSVNKLSGSSPASALGPAVDQLNQLNNRIKIWLIDHPEEKTVFTDAFTKRLETSLHSLSAALSATASFSPAVTDSPPNSDPESIWIED